MTKGELLVTFDPKAVLDQGYNLETAVLVSNSSDYLDVLLVADGSVTEGDDLLVALSRDLEPSNITSHVAKAPVAIVLLGNGSRMRFPENWEQDMDTGEVTPKESVPARAKAPIQAQPPVQKEERAEPAPQPQQQNSQNPNAFPWKTCCKSAAIGCNAFRLATSPVVRMNWH